MLREHGGSDALATRFKSCACVGIMELIALDYWNCLSVSSPSMTLSLGVVLWRSFLDTSINLSTLFIQLHLVIPASFFFGDTKQVDLDTNYILQTFN